jgi:hypothetical protein
MARPKPNEQGKTGKSDKPKATPNAERTQPLPKYQKVLDEHFTNWPSEDDNDRAGGGK